MKKYIIKDISAMNPDEGYYSYRSGRLRARAIYI